MTLAFPLHKTLSQYTFCEYFIKGSFKLKAIVRCRNFSGNLKSSIYGYVRHGKGSCNGTHRLASAHVVIGWEQVEISGQKSQHLQSTKSFADKSFLSTESWGLLCWVRGHGKELQENNRSSLFLITAAWSKPEEIVPIGTELLNLSIWIWNASGSA